MRIVDCEMRIAPSAPIWIAIPMRPDSLRGRDDRDKRAASGSVPKAGVRLEA